MSDIDDEATEMDRLTKTVGDLAGSVDGIKTLVANQAQGQQNLQQSLQSLTDSLANGLQKDGEQTQNKDVDLSELDNAGVAQFLLSEMTKITEKSAKDIRDEFASFKADSAKSERSRELNDLIADHKDAESWISEMGAIANNNPNLSIEQMYKLARSENPEKSAEKDKEFADKTDDGDDKDEGPLFAGLTPTSSNAELSLVPDSDKQISRKEGILKAWDEVMPDHMKQEAVNQDPLV